ncbi:MAG TPA: bifunctional phosphoribosylaminoimidazolecarboxamide formyltransferase/inosine monophosphate cyclohydrolase, partial [Ktedonobacter sp.]|nr:bifunctional phosphoribosylaminoimidazolecarboxamide formyltransferase/inosine monophosphate cyclohydrolase [Ktedonobacter sp.]
THRPIEPMKAQGTAAERVEVRSVSGGLLLQTTDQGGAEDVTYTVMTDRAPTLEEVTDLMFAWKAVQHVKSNAIVLAHNLMLVGVGAGQMNRVTSVQIAVEKAGERARGSVLA